MTTHSEQASLLSRARRLVGRGSRRGRAPRTASGLDAVAHEARWASFNLGRAVEAVEISGRLEGGAPGQEKSVIGRVRVFDRDDRPLDHLVTGLRKSEAAGKYFYPLEYVRDGVFRYSLAVPAGTARVEIALQHWRRADQTLYGQGPLALTPVAAVVNTPTRIAAGSPDVALERLREAEVDLRQALRRYADRLGAVTGPLYADEAPFGEPLAEYMIHEEGLADAAGRLAGRRLRAGRDREAAALIGLCPEPELEKAYGRRRLHDHVAAAQPKPAAAPRLKGRSLVYLLHNALPHDSGGYAARSHGLLTGFVKAGWDVLAVTRPGYPADRGGDAAASEHVIDGVTYLNLPEDAGLDGPDQVAYVHAFAERLMEALKGRDVGMIQAASFFQNALAGRIVADRLGVPLVYEMRGMEWLTRSSNDPRWLDSDQCQLMRDLELMAARGADHVFAITGALRDWLVASGVEADRIEVLPNGCSPDSFQPRAPDPELVAELGVEDAFVVAYIGSFALYESIPDIITATGRAREIFGGDIRLLLVGDGQTAPAVEQHILETGAQDYVIRTGRAPHDRIPDYYAVSDALVLARRDIPLTHMISPLKPLEALAMGKHVISTDVAAVREILDAAGVGRIVAPGAPYGLAYAIAEAARDRDLLRAQSRTAREWAVRDRDWAVLAARALELLESRFADAPSSV